MERYENNSILLCVNGGFTVASLPKQDGPELLFQLSKISAGCVVAFRFDFSLSLPSGVSIALSLNSYKVGSGSPFDDGVWIDFNGCKNVLNGDDSNACTADYAVGDYCSRYCSWTTKDCDDGNSCSQLSCVSTTGKCCSLPDGIACTEDYCTACCGCQHSVADCSDYNEDCNAHTFDFYYKKTGCQHSTVYSNHITYHPEECNTEYGCEYTLVVCDDDNLCTIINCNLESYSCAYHIDCCYSYPCTKDYCNPVLPCHGYGEYGNFEDYLKGTPPPRLLPQSQKIRGVEWADAQ
jgi:hypothetical protein